MKSVSHVVMLTGHATNVMVTVLVLLASQEVNVKMIVLLIDTVLNVWVFVIVKLFISSVTM